MARKGVVSADIYANAVETVLGRVLPDDVLMNSAVVGIIEAQLDQIRSMDTNKWSLDELGNIVDGILDQIQHAISETGFIEDKGVVSAEVYARYLSEALNYFFDGLDNMPPDLKLALRLRCTVILRNGEEMSLSKLKGEVDAFFADRNTRADILLSLLGTKGSATSKRDTYH